MALLVYKWFHSLILYSVRVSAPYTTYRPIQPTLRKSKKKQKILLSMALFVGVGCLSLYLENSGTISHSTSSQTASTSTSTTPITVPIAPKIQTVSPVLESKWKSILGGRQGNVDIALYNNKTGEVAHVTNATGTYNTASIVKLSILEEILLQDQKDGTTISSYQLSEAKPMIENSDNDAATALWNEVGDQPAMDSLFNQLGATSTQVNADGYWGLTQSTAVDQLSVLNAFAYPGKLISSNSATLISNLLANVESDQTWGVSAGVPTGVTIELKNGWLPDSQTDDNETTESQNWTVNSIGHIYGNGADYTIAVLTDHQTSEEYGIETIEELSTAAWNIVG
ncbi:MAG: hypothetical protein JWP06_363 [Candidatus Saccharibacteria bacterium]|nr:hypothetical protein [Candidatus Saccharibacteria bacterium]